MYYKYIKYTIMIIFLSIVSFTVKRKTDDNFKFKIAFTLFKKNKKMFTVYY